MDVDTEPRVIPESAGVTGAPERRGMVAQASSTSSAMATVQASPVRSRFDAREFRFMFRGVPGDGRELSPA